MGDDESRDEGWGNQVGGATFKWTMITTVLFVVVVFFYILL